MCALAATLFAVMLVVGVDALRFHGASPVLIAEALVLAVMAGSFAREAVRQRRFRVRLPAERRALCGTRCWSSRAAGRSRSASGSCAPRSWSRTG